MYILKINDSIDYKIDTFNESFDPQRQASFLTAFAKDEVFENGPLVSLSALSDAILTKDNILNLKIVDENELTIWESDRYKITDAQLNLQQELDSTDNESIEKSFIISSFHFIFSFGEEEEEDIEDIETDDTEQIEEEPENVFPESAPMPEEEYNAFQMMPEDIPQEII